MRGIAGTVLRLLYVSPMQRWLLGLGLILMAGGLWAQVPGLQPTARSLSGAAAMLGIAIAVIAPVVGGPMLFGRMSWPRAVWLIPHGRLKLALGAFCAQLLLALFVAVTLGVVLSSGSAPHAPPGNMESGLLAKVFAIAFCGLTVYFLSWYWAMQFRYGGLLAVVIYVCAPRLLALAFPHAHPGISVMTPMAVSTLLTASLLAWCVFTITYVRTSPMNLPQPNTGFGLPHTRTAAANAAILNAAILRSRPRPARQDALRTMLTGIVSVRGLWRTLILGVAVTVVVSLLTAGTKGRGDIALMWAAMISGFAMISSAIVMGVLTRRARFLWLTAGLGRAELFTTVERQSWRLLFLGFGIAVVVAAPPLVFSGSERFLALLMIPFASGVATIYLSLLLVRGARLADNLIRAAGAAIIIAEFVTALTESRALYPLICAQIVLVPLLREVARRRWQTIDWLIHRVPRQAPEYWSRQTE